jgi:hypothetical protein
MAQSIDFSRARIDGRVPVALFVIGSWFMKLNTLSTRSCRSGRYAGTSGGSASSLASRSSA